MKKTDNCLMAGCEKFATLSPPGILCEDHTTWIRAVIGSDPLSPVPMLLTCPWCSARHIDEGEFATKPHHTHACQACGMVWRPALVATVGVRFLPGFKNGGNA